jgi:aminoglycoside phosphotransferase (APT) family kinase protein
MNNGATPGFEPARVDAWICARVPSLCPPLTWKRLPGGHSNLTYLITDAYQQRAVIRRPPLGKLIPKAHDMAREWALISALEPTDVPVPAALAFCDDPSVADAHFYLMGHVEGHALASADDTRRYVPEALRRPLALNFIDVLASLHRLEPGAVGLSGLGKPDNYVARQISAWYKSWIASAGPANYDDPRAHALRDLMLEKAPLAGAGRIVHGDFGLHNCLIDQNARIAAVIDWEISTIGDPLADLSYALLQFPEVAGAPASPVVATAPPGFPSRAELAQHYAERTGSDLADLDFYYGFNLWRTAAIAHGVYARYVRGQKDSDGVNLEAFRAGIDQWLSAAETILRRWKG